MAPPPGFRLLLNPVHFLALGGGSGLLPKAPGTAGSVVALLPCWLLLPSPPEVRLAVALAALLAGIAICGISARRLGVPDHPAIVFDEIAAMLWFTLSVPASQPGWLLVAFLLFRYFDIRKPWPIRELDHRLHGGAGIMLDDQVAALFATALLLIIMEVTGLF